MKLSAKLIPAEQTTVLKAHNEAINEKEEGGENTEKVRWNTVVPYSLFMIAEAFRRPIQ